VRTQDGGNTWDVWHLWTHPSSEYEEDSISWLAINSTNVVPFDDSRIIAMVSYDTGVGERLNVQPSEPWEFDQSLPYSEWLYDAMTFNYYDFRVEQLAVGSGGIVKKIRGPGDSTLLFPDDSIVHFSKFFDIYGSPRFGIGRRKYFIVVGAGSNSSVLACRYHKIPIGDPPPEFMYLYIGEDDGVVRIELTLFASSAEICTLSLYRSTVNEEGSL